VGIGTRARGDSLGQTGSASGVGCFAGNGQQLSVIDHGEVVGRGLLGRALEDPHPAVRLTSATATAVLVRAPTALSLSAPRRSCSACVSDVTRAFPSRCEQVGTRQHPPMST